MDFLLISTQFNTMIDSIASIPLVQEASILIVALYGIRRLSNLVSTFNNN